MIVCIAEKPSVARDIASILGANKRIVHQGAGYIEGNGYQVTWTFGHLCTLKEPHDYTSDWKEWRLNSLPLIPERFGIKSINIDLYKRQLAIIKKLLHTAMMVINCGDAGQEGELIQRWVLQKAGCNVPVKRLWISSLTDEALREGFSNLREEEEFRSLYEAGLARSIGDWLLGINATRLYSIRYGGRGQVLSIGRVQTPTLALIVQRQDEIERFSPETYWELKTVYRDTLFTAEKSKYKDREKAEQILANITNSPIQITSVKKKISKELPPRLFDLTSLQVACNKKFGMTAEQTLSTIQLLYEKKITTYPRVDSTYLSDDIYPKIKNILLGLVAYRPLVEPILANKTIRKSKKVFDSSKVTDHHAIIPTGQPAHGLTDMETKVFDLVTKHFIAAFYPDCCISTTTILGKVNQVNFKTSGKEVLEPGWREVFESPNKTSKSETQSKDEENEQDEVEYTLPAFIEGESGEHSPSLKERQTQPPKPYTEATLLRAMETAGKLIDNDELRDALKENGIGRPSTRASIIETLFKRGYITKEKRKELWATPTGVRLIRTINYDLLKSAELTGQWERKLRQIERKELEAKTFLDELKALVRHLTISVLMPHTLSTPNLPTCPKCRAGQIIRGHTAYGCNRYAEGCDYRLSYDEYAQTYPRQ